MLKREESQALLQKEGSNTWREEACAAIGNDVPENLRPTAYGLLNCDEHGTLLPTHTQADWERRQQVETQAFARLGKLDGGQRLAIFTALLPGMASHVEAGWRLFSQLPYQTGYVRKAFRVRVGDPAPGMVRTQWLQQILSSLGEYRQKDVTWVAAWAPYLGSYGGYALATDRHPVGCRHRRRRDRGRDRF